MTLPPTLFQELENVELMLMTKEDRVGRNFSYTLGDPDQTIVYTIVEEKLSTCICEDRRLPLKLKMMYEGKEVMKLDRVRALETCFTICCNLWPCTYIFRVCSPAENVIGHMRLSSWFILGRIRVWWRYIILDENKKKIFGIIRNKNSLFGSVPLSVQRVSNKELVAQICRRWMMEPLGGIRPTPLQRWGARFLVPMPLKEKVLILTMTLFVDYSKLSTYRSIIL